MAAAAGLERQQNTARERGYILKMTISDLILDCLRLGLDGEKVDYFLKKESDRIITIEFEDGKSARLTIEEND